MPNRIIKESICYSDDIDKLTAFEETVFYRMIVRADDYGRLDARPSFLKSMLFVTKQGITEKNVQDAVSRIGQALRSRRETVPIVSEMGFASKGSQFEGEISRAARKHRLRSFAATCGELRRVAASCRLNPIRIQSESESERERFARDALHATDR